MLGFRDSWATRLRTLVGVAILAVFLPRHAFAQSESAPHEEAAGENTERVELVHTPTPGDAKDVELVFDSFRTWRRLERARMHGTAFATVSLGAGMLVTGILLPEEARPWNLALGIAGGTMAFAGVLSLVMPTPAERMARQFSVDSEGPHTPEEAQQLERAWRSHARRMQTMRYVAGGLGVAVGAGELGLGVAWTAGAFSDSASADQEALGAILIGLGSATILSGLTTFLVQSPAELAFASYEESRSRRSAISVSVSPVSSGLAFGVSGVF